MNKLTVTEAAKQLNVAPSWVTAMIRDKRLRAIKIGGIWLISPAALAKLERKPVGRPVKVR